MATLGDNLRFDLFLSLVILWSISNIHSDMEPVRRHHIVTTIRTKSFPDTIEDKVDR